MTAEDKTAVANSLVTIGCDFAEQTGAAPGFIIRTERGNLTDDPDVVTVLDAWIAANKAKLLEWASEH